MTGSSRLFLFVKLLDRGPLWKAVWSACSLRSPCPFSTEARPGCGVPSKAFPGGLTFTWSLFTAKSLVIIIRAWNNVSQVPLSHSFVISLRSVKSKPFLWDV